MTTDTPQHVAALHLSFTVVTGKVRATAQNRLLFVCAAALGRGAAGELAVSLSSAKTWRGAVRIGKSRELGDGQYEIEIAPSPDAPGEVDALSASLRKAQPRPRRVLIVDDSELLNNITSSILGRAGYQTMAITAPLEIYKAIQSHAPDLALVDYNIPALRGDELIKMTKQLGVKTPMVLYSSAGDVVLAEAMTRAGAMAYIKKGGPREELLAQVDAIFRQLGWGESGPPSSARPSSR